MTGQAADRIVKKGWRRRVAGFVVAFAISLIVGRFVETVASKPVIDAALRAQTGWMEALSDFSPWGVAKLFGDKASADMMSRERQSYLNAEGRIQYTNSSGGPQDGLAVPMKALLATVAALVAAGGVVGLVQIGMGVLAVWLVLDWLKRRRNVEITSGPLLFVGWPVAVILAASLIAVALKAVMVAALGALSWATGLAAGAAGATGVVGFCWYCLQ
jgi:hypothetical protein